MDIGWYSETVPKFHLICSKLSQTSSSKIISMLLPSDVIHPYLGAFFFRTIKFWMNTIYFLMTKQFKVLNGQINSNTFASDWVVFLIYSMQLIGKVFLLLAYSSCVYTQTSWNWNTWKKILLKIIYSVIFSMFLWDMLNATQFGFFIN